LEIITMVRKPKKGQTYWLAGHRCYSELHVVPVTAKGVYDDDNAIDGIIDVSAVPTAFRSSSRCNDDEVRAVIDPAALFATRKAAAAALAIQLVLEQSKLCVAATALRKQFTIEEL
jgi:hypothetical protein